MTTKYNKKELHKRVISLGPLKIVMARSRNEKFCYNCGAVIEKGEYYILLLNLVEDKEDFRSFFCLDCL